MWSPDMMLVCVKVKQANMGKVVSMCMGYAGGKYGPLGVVCRAGEYGQGMGIWNMGRMTGMLVANVVPWGLCAMQANMGKVWEYGIWEG